MGRTYRLRCAQLGCALIWATLGPFAVGQSAVGRSAVDVAAVNMAGVGQSAVSKPAVDVAAVGRSVIALAAVGTAESPAKAAGAASSTRPAAKSSQGQSAARAKPGASGAPSGKPTRPKQKPGEVLDIDWRDLLPESERARYSDVAPPPQHGPLGEGGPPAVQKQTPAANADLAGINVRLPGFVVPIGAPRNGMVTEFFLVPYIGACIHVPPPPTNQMVFVTSAAGIATDAIHEAYWVTGKMRLETRTTALGSANYALIASKVELYQY